MEMGVQKKGHETKDILNYFQKVQIGTLQEDGITLECRCQQAGAVYTLPKVDATFQRLGTPIPNIPIMLDTSIQNNAYGVSKNFLKFSHFVQYAIHQGRVGKCKDPILFDLISYVDVRVQSNPFVY